MGKFQRGDRVAVYMNDLRLIGTIENIAAGAIRPNAVVTMLVRPDNPELQGKYGWYNPKQCRRLVKRERRRVYFELLSNGDGYSNSGDIFKSLKPGEKVEFIEAKRPVRRKGEG